MLKAILFALLLPVSAFAKDSGQLEFSGDFSKITKMSDKSGDDIACVYNSAKTTIVAGARKKIGDRWPEGFTLQFPADTDLNSEIKIEDEDPDRSIAFTTVEKALWFANSCTVSFATKSKMLNISVACPSVEDMLSPTDAKRTARVKAMLSCSMSNLD
ncbi:MAG: hypothetical protein V4692_14830 [Bdellovibrionota bacterium]